MARIPKAIPKYVGKLIPASGKVWAVALGDAVAVGVGVAVAVCAKVPSANMLDTAIRTARRSIIIPIRLNVDFIGIFNLCYERKNCKY